MKIVKSIDRESLIKAGILCMKAADRYSEIIAEYPQEKILMNARPLDSRDLINIAVFLKFKPQLDGTGEPLTDEQFDAECRRLIKAFANDDREQIFGFLDDWYKFATNYTAPEHVETVDDALANFVYISSQQGISVTKLGEFPDYYRSRYPDLDSMMKLQNMQSEISIQTAQEVPMFFQNGLQIDSDSFRQFENTDPEKYKNQPLMPGLEDFKDRFMLEAIFDKAFLDAFKLTEVAPKDQVSVRKMVVPAEMLALKDADKNSPEYKNGVEILGNAVHASTGTTQTGFGLMKTYADLAGTITNYRMIFIDGVSIFDMLPEPKAVADANAMLLDALNKQTGVVTFAHVAHINDKFEYRIDVLDTRTGENDNPEYVQKITALDDEKARKELFGKCVQSVSSVLEPAYENYVKNGFEKIRNAANEQIAKGNEENKDLAYAPPKADKQHGMQSAFFTVDEVRRQYLGYAKEYLQTHPVAKKNFEDRKLDERDFQDLFLFTELAGTLGLGDHDLTPDEAKVETGRMVEAFASQDHNAIRTYFDRMFTFLQNYTVPENIDTMEDWAKAVAYIRVQQTSVVKLIENPWYLKERFHTELDQSKFDAFEANYYVAFDDLLRSMKRQTGLKLAFGSSLAEILEEKRKADVAAGDRAPDEVEFDEEQFDVDTIRSPYYKTAYSVTSRRIMRLNDATTPEGNYTFKVKLPHTALSCVGEGISDAKIKSEANNFFFEFIEKIYNASYSESNIIRSYNFKNKDAVDSMRLIFLDGKSAYDIVTEDGQKPYDHTAAKKLVFTSLINQNALVQFAHITQGEDELKVELDTLDVTNRTMNKADYAQKLADFEKDPTALHETIKANINETFKAHKKQIEDMIESSKQYDVEAKEQEAGILGMDADLIAEQKPEKQAAEIDEDDLRRRRAHSAEKREERQAAADAEKAFENAEVLDLSTFKDGRYAVSARSPYSAYALASMSEMRNLEVFFGSMNTEEYPKDYIDIGSTEDFNSLERRDGEDFKTYAVISGLNVNARQLHSVMYQFMHDNLSGDGAHVDRTIFERQYMILFGDLYIQSLHALNKRALKNGEIISADDMDKTLNMLDKIMQNTAYSVGYPEEIFRGGFSPEGLKTLRENFVKKFVPKNAMELGLRKMQACSKGFDFTQSDWKKARGYTDFTKMVNNEKGKLNKPGLWSYADKLKAVQTVRAMEEYHNSRSRWSRFWNFRKSAKELSAIDEYKTMLKTSAKIYDVDYNELYADAGKVDDVSSLNKSIAALYVKDKACAEKGWIVDESEYSLDEHSIRQPNRHVDYGMGEKESELDYENENSEYMDESREENSSVIEEPAKQEKPMVEKIVVAEANDKTDKRRVQEQARKTAQKDLERKITDLK